jgi:hypothetical protein
MRMGWLECKEIIGQNPFMVWLYKNFSPKAVEE